MKPVKRVIMCALVNTLFATYAWSEEGMDMDHGNGEHGSMKGMSSGGANKNDMSMDDMSMGKEMDQGDHHMKSGEHSDHDGMKMSMPMMGKGRAQGGSAPPNARDPHANSGGFKRDPLRRLSLADEKIFASLMIDRLEVVRSGGDVSEVFDAQGWVGYDYERLVFKTEGDISDKELAEMSTEVLWGHAVDTFWDTQLGLRYDTGDGPNRGWLAMGIQGLAPYWFELDTTFYVGENFQTSLSIEAEYELLLTQKLILQPRMEGTLYSKSDKAVGAGQGLSDLAVGLRLRYEFKREIAPYIGVEWAAKFGDAADVAKKSGGEESEARLLAGLKFWF